ncbi:MAG: hypothetical protein JJ848_001320 [Prochlorococcus marinus CUG1439]|uniref:hypothetical protein n=1 Tax=Prochlorococcus sp. MIT 1314 TaxID=3096220 RepID=UPI001B013081|nr:hypothetical protein [Prochlorococcus sp. MIT 1314]MCR8538978.1 hypothetical protein [Prochlorococcus marinus CUG1439]
MKLFKSLLVTQAVLGLLAPMTTAASEINLNEMNNYARKKSSSKNRFNSQTFTNQEFAKTNNSNKNTKAPINLIEAGSFSETTTMSGSASFVIGGIRNHDLVNYTDTSEAINAHYSYNVDLNTSFNGEDNLFVGIEAGNNDGSGTVLLDSTNVVANADQLSVSSIYYSFPFIGWDVAVGPLLAQDDLVATTTSKYSDAFYLSGNGAGNNVWTLPGLKGTGIAAAKFYDNGFNIGANLLSVTGNSTGVLTEESTEMATLMTGYDAENFGGGIILTKYDTVWGHHDKTAQYYLDYYGVSKLQVTAWQVGGYWTLKDKLTTNIGLEVIDADIGLDSPEFTYSTLSMDYEFNENNRISGAWKYMSFLNTNGTIDQLGDAFEFYYTHDVNDAVSVKAGIYLVEADYEDGNGTSIKNGGTGDDWLLYDETVYAFETIFRF